MIKKGRTQHYMTTFCGFSHCAEDNGNIRDVITILCNVPMPHGENGEQGCRNAADWWQMKGY